MKICPQCKQKFSDTDLNFCLNDGTVLQTITDDAPPTIFIDPPRQTAQNWQNSTFGNPPANTPLPIGQRHNLNQFGAARIEGNNQTLAIVSMVSGVLGIVLVCCWLGVPLGIVGMITGYSGMNNANNNPAVYGGKNMAIGGLVLSIVSFVIGLGFILITLISPAK